MVEERETKASAQAVAVNSGTPSVSLRWLGIAPLIFFLGQATYYWRGGSLGNMLWMCNVGNLLLALGLFIEQPELIRAAAIWMIPGVPIWILYVVLPDKFVLSSGLAHIGGLIVALVAVRTVRIDRRAWLYAFAWYLAMQIVSRLATSPDLNVNVAYRIQGGWESSFGSFWKFWVVMSAVVAIGLWIIGRLLRMIWPAVETP